jgi:2-iminoacetate synthase
MHPFAAMTLSENATDFIDDDHLSALTRQAGPSKAQFQEILAKSLSKQALTLDETAALLCADEPELVEQIFDTARRLKQEVYGNRIVLFAPLYIGNNCVNDCRYCGFRRSNHEQRRATLSTEEIRKEVKAMEDRGHKRMIIVFGEAPQYDAEFIASCVREIYAVRSGHGEMRRVNVNASPLNVDDFKIVKASNIGTYQIFMETYHHATYAAMHPRDTRKGDYLYRLDAMDRAMQAGIDDVGIGALFGLYDWKFEVMGLVAHALHLQQRFGVGPHTISFPRLKPASGVALDYPHVVNDDNFKRLIAILRLAVPYTGLICTARENGKLRREVMSFGISQIDAGSRIEIGGYTDVGDAQVREREQFELGDIRPVDVVIRELLQDGYVPSFCTACYRLGRTGEHFMEFAIPGFIKRFCTPNAISTLCEYLEDYASPETKAAGYKMIEQELVKLEDAPQKKQLLERLERIKKTGDRDLYF